MMGSGGAWMVGMLGVWHLALLIAILALIFWPAIRILHKAGYSGWWSLLGIVPLVNLVMIWVFAYANWPRLRRAGTAPPPSAAAPG